MKNVISDLKSQLLWAVEEKTSPEGYFEIVSDPFKKMHTILFPAEDSPSGPPREIELAHELVHALLAERVHHQFGGHYFKKGTPDRWIQLVGWACRAATDWFVDYVLFSIAAEDEAKEIAEHFEIICKIFERGTPQSDILFLLSSGFIIAQAIKYLGVQVQTGGQLKQVVGAFLSVDPSEPSIEALVDLINSLLASYTNLRIRLVVEEGLEVFEIFEN